MLQRIHSSHIGVEGSLRRACENLFWLGMTKDAKNFVTKLIPVVLLMTNRGKWSSSVMKHIFVHGSKELMICLVTIQRSTFWPLIITKTFGRWTISTTPNQKTVIRKRKALFARDGIPDILVSYDGPQFASSEFQKFAHNWECCHVINSPK